MSRSSLVRRVAAIVLPVAIVAGFALPASAATTGGPNVSGVNPSPGFTGTIANVTITGDTGLVQGSRGVITFTANPPVTGQNPINLVETSSGGATPSPGTITGTIDLSTAAPTFYDVVATDALGRSGNTCVKCYYVIKQGPPTVSSVARNPAGPPGSLTVTGTNFANGDVISLLPTGQSGPQTLLTIDSLTLANGVDTLATHYNGIGSNPNSGQVASAGIYDLKATGLDAQSATKAGVFSQPQVVNAAPNALGRSASGKNVDLSVTNQAGTPIVLVGDGVTADPKVSAGAASVPSAGIVRSALSVASDAPTGPRDLTLWDSDGGFVRATSILTIDQAPIITGFGNGVGQNSPDTTVIVSGSGFVTGASPTVFALPANTSDVTIARQTVDSQIQATLHLTALPNAVVGGRQISVVNPDFGNSATATPATGLQVIAAPAISSVSTNNTTSSTSCQRGACTLTINGTNFAATGNGPTFQAFDSVSHAPINTLTFGTPTTLSTTKVIVPINIPSGVASGLIDIKVTNPSDLGNSTFPGAFSIDTIGLSPNVLSNTNPQASITLTGQGTTWGPGSVPKLRLLGPAQTYQGEVVGALSGTPSAGGLTAVFNLSGITPGKYTVVVDTPANGQTAASSDACVGCFSVLQPQAPTISGVATGRGGNALGAGAQSAPLVITGSNLSNGTQIGFSGTDITVLSTAINTAHTQLTALVNVAGSAAPGSRSISLTSRDGKVSSPTGSITITAGPIISSITPTSRGLGAAQKIVTIAGSNFATQVGVTISQPDYLTVGAATATGGSPNTTVSFPLTVGNSATSGVHTITVTNTADYGSASTSFTLNPAPSITSLSQPVRAPGAGDVSQTIAGSGFISSPDTPLMVLSPAGGVTVGALSITSPNQATVTFNVPTSAARGYRDVTFINGDGGVRTITNAFAVGTVASPPSNVSVGTIDGGLVVNWAAPTDNGGLPLTGYTVSPTACNPGCSLPAAQSFSDPSTTQATFPNLVNGKTYSFVVTALNGAGVSAPSATVSGNPATAPGAPTDVTAVAHNASATVSWTPPANDGGSPITKYLIASTGGQTASTPDGSSTSAVVSGLINGSHYTFTVIAVNAAGSSPSSAASNEVVPQPVAPDAPTSLHATSIGDTQVDLAWNPPTSDGNSAITGYNLSITPQAGTVTVDSQALTAHITGLTNGTSYAFSVTATNAIGTSPASSAIAVTPYGAPDAPGVPSASAYDARATVSWVPHFNGGRPVSDWIVKITDSTTGAVTTYDTQSAAGTQASIPGLTNGDSYTFQVYAVNARGVGAISGASAAVTPKAVTTLSIGGTGVLVYGQTATIVGTLKRVATNTVIGGATIAVTKKDAKGVISHTTALTNSSGVYNVVFKPSLGTTVTVSYAGSGSTLAAAAISRVVTVVQKVTITSPANGNRSAAASKLTITGNVGPSAVGRTVSLYSLASNGARTFVGSAKVSTSNVFTFVGYPKAGTYRYQVSIGAVTGLLAGNSSVITVYRV